MTVDLPFLYCQEEGDEVCFVCSSIGDIRLLGSRKTGEQEEKTKGQP